MYCICCKRNNVIPIDITISEKADTEEDFLWFSEPRKDMVGIKTIDNMNTESGIIQRISAGYGSSHDTSTFLIAICDECISEQLADATLLYWGNYMSPGSSWDKEDKEKSKQMYRRRKNLDSLI